MATATTSSSGQGQDENQGTREASAAASEAAELITLADLAALVDRATKVIEAWRNDDSAENFQHWRGQSVKMVSEAITASVDLVFEAANTMDVERDAYELVLAIDRAENEFVAWAEGLTRDGIGTNPEGNWEMWRAWDQILPHCSPRPKKLPEPIEALVSQGVALQQIARTYGWYLPGTEEPDQMKVQEERSKPGTHFDPKTWLPRKEIRRRELIEQEWEKRRLGRADRKTYREIKRLMEEGTGPAKQQEKEKVDAPETLDELIQQRVPVRQIVQMKVGITEEDVRIRAAQLGVALDGKVMQYATPHEALQTTLDEVQREQDEALAMQQLNTHDEAETVEDRILAMAADGHDWKTIFKSLRDKIPEGLSAQKVRGVLQSKAAK